MPTYTATAIVKLKVTIEADSKDHAYDVFNNEFIDPDSGSADIGIEEVTTFSLHGLKRIKEEEE
jgi:hypothetical protein